MKLRLLLIAVAFLVAGYVEANEPAPVIDYAVVYANQADTMLDLYSAYGLVSSK